jgi:hypothetical protein
MGFGLTLKAKKEIGSGIKHFGLPVKYLWFKLHGERSRVGL